ncbi:hypothetical protein M501DRAFT_995838 [Patellaria atrata CBS 101060]|uniref:Uncharacterized protein n=1 Tax=Patellaria atrata CBS 101060 TaxID=1346257 RepID=A0A9P4VL95_9PEZI|nr:hypothetical protein M501DRAFT_995838 [Patellaria atrata CBS 101060]
MGTLQHPAQDPMSHTSTLSRGAEARAHKAARATYPTARIGESRLPTYSPFKAISQPERDTDIGESVSTSGTTVKDATHFGVDSNSQESYISTSSSNSSIPQLFPSSSNISTVSAPDTELASPSSVSMPSSQSQQEKASPKSQKFFNEDRGGQARPLTPRIDTEMKDGVDVADVNPSPMVVDTPVLAQGSKRTASGAIKSSVLNPFPTALSAPRHSRIGSTEMGPNRIVELSAQLKARLSYAMIKVQNGWERRSIEDLEEMSSRRASPALDSSLASPAVSTFDRARRPSGLSESSDRLLRSPGSQGSPVRARFAHSNYSPPSTSSALSKPVLQPNYASFWADQSSSEPSNLSTSVPTGGLAPAPELVSRRNRRSNTTNVPPMLGSTPRSSKNYSSLTSPTTPTATTRPARQGILRMPSQQAEKDAVDTLLFMSSPNNSARIAHTSLNSVQPSPLRTEFPAKKVVFEQPGTVGRESVRVRAAPPTTSWVSVNGTPPSKGQTILVDDSESDDDIPVFDRRKAKHS